MRAQIKALLSWSLCVKTIPLFSTDTETILETTPMSHIFRLYGYTAKKHMMNFKKTENNTSQTTRRLFLTRSCFWNSTGAGKKYTQTWMRHARKNTYSGENGQR